MQSTKRNWHSNKRRRQRGERGSAESRDRRQAGTRVSLYASEIRLAHSDWQAGRIQAMRDRLERIGNMPEGDFREFAWHYLDQLSRRRDFVELKGHKQAVTTLAVNRDGTLLATAGHDAEVLIWDTSTWKQKTTISVAGAAPTLQVVFSPDGKQLAALGNDGQLRIWDLATKTVVRTFPGHASGDSRFAFSPQGRYLASVSRALPNSRLQVWDLRTGERLHALNNELLAGSAITFKDENVVTYATPVGVTSLTSPAARSTHCLATWRASFPWATRPMAGRS